MYVDFFTWIEIFENLRQIMPGRSTLNTTSADEHVPEIERQIIVTKGRAIAIWINLPFNKIPGHIFIEVILFVVLWLNTSPPVGGISLPYSL